jgi:sulfotransferase
MKKSYHFICGMPRSGSILLANLLAQNPRFETTGTNELAGVIKGIREGWNSHLAAPEDDEQAKLRIMRGVLDSYYSTSSRPVVFAKSHVWLSMAELLELILERKAKFLVTVRDLRAVLASFEKLWRESSGTHVTPWEQKHRVNFLDVEGRCNVWLRKDEAVGMTYARIEDALLRGFRNRMHWVHFEELTRNPRSTLKKIYDFLEEPYFEHDFDHIEQVCSGADDSIGLADMPGIRSRIEPVKADFDQILGPVAQKFDGIYVWDQPQWK